MHGLPLEFWDTPSSGIHKLVIADAVFSMDGDIIDLPQMVALCRKYNAWLMVDEAHIAMIATHPEYRRKGIGEKLMVGFVGSGRQAVSREPVYAVTFCFCTSTITIRSALAMEEGVISSLK